MDWLIDKMVAAGYTPVLERGGIDPDGVLSAALFADGQCRGRIHYLGINVDCGFWLYLFCLWYRRRISAAHPAIGGGYSVIYRSAARRS